MDEAIHDNRFRRLLKSRWRLPVGLMIVLALGAVVYAVWSPGRPWEQSQYAGRDNAIWMQHGWLGGDSWFTENDRTDRLAYFRDPATIDSTLAALHSDGIATVFPHLCPTTMNGAVADWDDEQVERFLDAAAQHELRVLPWIGGVLWASVNVESTGWRARFIASVLELLESHPRLAGVHVNIEPLPSGNEHFVALLDELRAALPADKILSLAAYPPPLPGVADREVYWEPEYMRRLAEPVDQMVFMLYDTGYPLGKPYVALVDHWSETIATAGFDAQILLGVPAYDDDVPWHNPRAEQFENGLRGVRRSLDNASVSGVAIYSDWEMDAAEWAAWRAGLGQAGVLRDDGGR